MNESDEDCETRWSGRSPGGPMLRWWIGVGVFLGLSAAGPALGQSGEGWSAEGDGERRAEVVRRYREMLEENPKEGVIFEKLVEYVGRGEGLDRLIEKYRQKVDDEPDRLAYRLLLGHLLKAKHEYEDALEQYDEAVELAPSSATALASRASVHAEKGRRKEAIEDYEKALESVEEPGRKKKMLRTVADLAFQQHDWERAESYYEQLVEMDPRNEYLRVEFAKTLMEYERWEKALEQYEKLLELAGQNPKARAKTLRDMGEVHEKMGDTEKAVETYRRAMGLMRSGHWLHEELRERVVDVYRKNDELPALIEEYENRWGSPGYSSTMLLAKLSDEAGLEEKAVDYYERAKRLRTRKSKPREKLVEIWRRRGETERVLEGYRELVDISSGTARYYFKLVELHMQGGRSQKAEEWLERIASRFDDQSSVYADLAEAYRRYGMTGEARETYEALVEMAPDNESHILNLGETYYRSGDVERAVETWKKLLDTSMAEAEARARLADVYAEHGMIERAVRQYREAVDSKPDDLGLRRGLASVYERARRWEKAVEIWRGIMDRADRGRVIGEARGRIIEIYERQNRLREKMDEFRRRFTEDEGRVEAGFFLAESHRTLGQYEQAEETYRRLLDLEAADETDRAEAYRALEGIYRETGELEQAVEVLRELAELVPEQQRRYYQEIAELSLKLYADDQAVEYAALAVEKNPEDPEAHANLGEVYREMQKLEAAAEEYRRAVQLASNRPKYSMALAEILAKLGRDREARETFLRVARQAKDRGMILRAARRAMDLFEQTGALERLESAFADMTFQGSNSRAYRKVMLEIYERMLGPEVLRARYGVAAERDAAHRRLEEASPRAVPVLKAALHDDGVGQRALAIRLLGGMRANSAAVPLAQMAVDSEESLRTLAAISVAEIGDPDAAQTLVNALDQGDSSLREITIWTLGYLDADPARRGLVRQLEEGQNWRERALAAVGLGRIGTSAASDELEAVLRALPVREAEEGLVAAVVHALGETGDESAIPLLEEVLQQGSDATRRPAAEAMASIGGGPAVDALLEGLWSRREGVVSAARAGLVVLAGTLDGEERAAGGEDRFESLARDLEHIEERKNEMDVQGIVARFSARSDIPSSKPVAGFFARRGDRAVEMAASILEEDGEAARRVLSSLHRGGELRLGPLVPDGDEAERDWRGSLTSLSNAIAERVESEDASVAAHALELYGRVGGEGRRETLHRAVGGERPLVRRAAIRALGRLPAESGSVDRLVDRLGSSSFLERRVAALALGQTAGRTSDGVAERVVSALVEQLDDEYPSVRMAAARGLAALGTPSAVEALAERLESFEFRVKLVALEALSELDVEAAREVVGEYRDDPDVRIRRAVASD